MPSVLITFLSSGRVSCHVAMCSVGDVLIIGFARGGILLIVPGGGHRITALVRYAERKIL